MPGRATCEECQKLKLQDCQRCNNPGPLLDENTQALEVWKTSVKISGNLRLKYEDIRMGTEVRGAGLDDFEKALIINRIYQELNGRK